MVQVQNLREIPKSELASRERSTRDLSIDYLRTTLTLMVLAHHSSLAYTSWAHFDRENIFRSTAPIADTTRWVFFDYAENFNDVFFMSLMFFVSGLFVYPALRRHGTLGFIRERFLRLGIPFALAVTLVIPAAYYASWQLSMHDAGFFDFYKRLAMNGFTAGPPWFVWVLLLFDIVLALILATFKSKLLPIIERSMRSLKSRALSAFAGAFVLAACVYLPLLSIYGFEKWTVLFTSPFAFQSCRIGLYFFWFLFGALVGVPGINDGLLSRDGSLTRHWRLWVLLCIAAYNALWFLPKSSPIHNLSISAQWAIGALLWVGSCVSSSFGFLALFRGAAFGPHSWMLSFNRSAYTMYLVHYAYITWAQRLMLDRPIPAAFKFVFVFLATTLLSWLTAQLLLRVPKLRMIL